MNDDEGRGIAYTVPNDAAFLIDFSDNTGPVNLSGYQFGDILRGGTGNDLLEGKAGGDTLAGGDGIDTAAYTTSSQGVTVNLGFGFAFAGDAEGDSLSGIENLQGSRFDDNLAGDGGANALFGLAGNDSLKGAGGADRLDGGIGADSMDGGADDDVYVVDNVGDTIFESTDAGTDTVEASINYTLADNVENLILTGTAGINGTGNELDNVLTGNSGRNALNGGAGADTFIGGGGADRLLGGAGDDTYVITVGGASVIEQAVEGTDTVRAFGNYTLSANVENLILTASSNANGTGNALANTITGTAGNNVLDGKGGADTLIGGLGNDTYIVDNAGDVIVELSGQGSDKVLASVSYTLADNVERLELTSVSNVSGTGNDGINTIIGSTGANTLTGLGGRDTLTGGAGRDTFVFTSISDSTVASTGRDTITDFTQADTDRIDLRPIDANSFLDGNQSFSFIGTSAFNGTAGQLRYEASGSNTLVSGDVDGNSVADFAILLTGQIALTSGNFLL